MKKTKKKRKVANRAVVVLSLAVLWLQAVFPTMERETREIQREVIVLLFSYVFLLSLLVCLSFFLVPLCLFVFLLFLLSFLLCYLFSFPLFLFYSFINSNVVGVACVTFLSLLNTTLLPHSFWIINILVKQSICARYTPNQSFIYSQFLQIYCYLMLASKYLYSPKVRDC